MPEFSTPGWNSARFQLPLQPVKNKYAKLSFNVLIFSLLKVI